MPAPPAAAARVFAVALPQAQRYAELLAGPGTERGLIGPREIPRLWDRHLLNCAVLTEAIPESATVCDVGSGAGLPGMVLAIRRSDLQVTLLEPLLRRTVFLSEVVDELGLDNVEVLRGRAEELHGSRTFRVVTSRAVAPLPKLLRWSTPLVEPGGEILAMKGRSAADELASAGDVLRTHALTEPEVIHLGSDVLDFPSTAVRLRVRPARD